MPEKEKKEKKGLAIVGIPSTRPIFGNRIDHGAGRGRGRGEGRKAQGKRL